MFLEEKKKLEQICCGAKGLNLQLTTLKNAFTVLDCNTRIVKNQIIKTISIPEKPLLTLDYPKFWFA